MRPGRLAPDPIDHIRGVPSFFWAVLLLIAGCAQGTRTPQDSGAPMAGVGDGTAASAASAPAGISVATPLPPIAPGDINKAIASAEDMLQAGNEDGARAELQRVLTADPNNRLAQLVFRQLSDDPIARLGRESFAYTVKGGDTLSKLARQYLGDIHLFYLLARYNSIKVPRQLQDGQVIRIPGKAPPPGAASTGTPAPVQATTPANIPSPMPPSVVTPTTPPSADQPPAADNGSEGWMQRGRAALSRNDLDGALNQFREAEKLGHPEASPQVQDVRKRLVERHSREARVALARQELDNAIKSWDKVLAIEPDNETARSERRKVRALKAKVEGL